MKRKYLPTHSVSSWPFRRAGWLSGKDSGFQQADFTAKPIPPHLLLRHCKRAVGGLRNDSLGLKCSVRCLVRCCRSAPPSCAAAWGWCKLGFPCWSWHFHLPLVIISLAKKDWREIFWYNYSLGLTWHCQISEFQCESWFTCNLWYVNQPSCVLVQWTGPSNKKSFSGYSPGPQNSNRKTDLQKQKLNIC